MLILIKKRFFLIKPFFHKAKKLRQNIKYLENEKSFSDEIKKHFSSIKTFYLEAESPTLTQLTKVLFLGVLLGASPS